MAFRLDGHWVWDFWFAREGGNYHMYFLQAPHALGDPEERHWHASVGHAVSSDLRNWTYLGICFSPAAIPAWDDGTTWTGSIIRHDGLWHFFYTGTSRADDCRRQRIGIATSTDLHRWRRHPANPVLDIDATTFEEYDPDLWHDRAFRDPWVASDPGGNGYRMWLTARVAAGAPDGRGVIATARSNDILHWTLAGPVTPPGDFGECEVPQYFATDDHAYLLFCTSDRRTSAAWRAKLASRGKVPETGTHYYMAERGGAAWRLAPTPFLSGSLYSGRIIEGPDRRLMFLGSFARSPDGTYVGTISDPIPVAVGVDGRLSLEVP